MSITALWPATAIESHVTSVLGVESKFMRQPEIFADACLAIAQENSDRYLNMLDTAFKLPNNMYFQILSWMS